MQAAAIIAIATTITQVLQAAPQISQAVNAVREFIASLYESGNIDFASQRKLQLHVDQVLSALADKQPPPQFTVEADPE